MIPIRIRIFILAASCFLSLSFSKGSLSCTIPVTGESFVTDNLGNAYVINGENIRKYNSNCQFQKEYNNKNFGAVTSVDATNALRLVLFYRDFSRIVFLDDMMSQIGDPVQLDALGFPTATLACSSHDNGLWIYDQQNSELIRLNRNLQIEQRTGNLAQLLDTTLQPDFILEKDTRLYLNNPATGVLVFDIFGTYSKTIPVKGLKSLQVIDDNIVYNRDHGLHMSNLITGEESLVQAQDTSAIEMRIEKEKTFVMRRTGIDTYYNK